MEQTKEELLKENYLLKVELALAHEMYPEQMRMVRDASATIKELIVQQSKLMARLQKDLIDHALIFIPRTT